MKGPYLKICFILGFILCLCVVYFAYNFKEQNNASSIIQINLNINKETAIKIAEAIFEQLYGAKVLEQRPWNIFDNGSAYEIRGTFNKLGFGGVAKIIINKSDGQVLYYIHGK